MIISRSVHRPEIKQIPCKRCARDKPDDRTATSRRERCQSLYDRFIPVPRLVFLRLFFREQGRNEVQILYSEQHIVKTRLGTFSLDDASYADYLAGKLWISWGAGSGAKRQTPAKTPVPVNVSEEAVRLRDTAAKTDVYLFLQEAFPGRQVQLPYRERMSGLSIDEMNLSVRSSNALMHANAKTFGRVRELIQAEDGLKKIRNLGIKSEKEITRSFFSACYYQLSPAEQAVFWQRLLDTL